MAYLNFLQSKDLIKCSVVPAGNIVTIKFPEGISPVISTKGFRLYLDAAGDLDIGGEDYLGYTTIFRNDDVTAAYNGYQLSNDGSVWTPPEPAPEPEPVPEPTLEELREAKVAEMNALQQAAIQSGVNVTLVDGAVEHFSLSVDDKIMLMGLQSRVMAGDDLIPWHNSNDEEHCKFYSNADMNLIITAAENHVAWHVTYCKDLCIYVRSLETKEEVADVAYGMALPEAYQSEPLKVMLAAQAGDIV